VRASPEMMDELYFSLVYMGSRTKPPGENGDRGAAMAGVPEESWIFFSSGGHFLLRRAGSKSMSISRRLRLLARRIQIRRAMANKPTTAAPIAIPMMVDLGRPELLDVFKLLLLLPLPCFKHDPELVLSPPIVMSFVTCWCFCPSSKSKTTSSSR